MSYLELPDEAARTRHRSSGPRSLLPFLMVSAGLALLGALTTTPASSGWFTGGPRAEWTPQTAVFTVAWTVVYLLDGIAGWLLWRSVRRGADLVPYVLYWVQIALQAGWLVAFLAQSLVHGAWLWGVFAVIVMLDIATAVTASTSWRATRPAAILLLVVLAWLLFGTALSGADTILRTSLA